MKHVQGIHSAANAQEKKLVWLCKGAIWTPYGRGIDSRQSKTRKYILYVFKQQNVWTRSESVATFIEKISFNHVIQNFSDVLIRPFIIKCETFTLRSAIWCNYLLFFGYRRPVWRECPLSSLNYLSKGVTGASADMLNLSTVHINPICAWHHRIWWNNINSWLNAATLHSWLIIQLIFCWHEMWIIPCFNYRWLILN